MPQNVYCNRKHKRELRFSHLRNFTKHFSHISCIVDILIKFEHEPSRIEQKKKSHEILQK